MCVRWFYDVFFTRLFDISPQSRTHFSGGMGRNCGFLISFVSSLLIFDKNLFESNMRRIGTTHGEMKIYPVEFGIMGDVLFYSLKTCLGDQFTDDIKRSWITIFSNSLKIIVPVCTEYQKKCPILSPESGKINSCPYSSSSSFTHLGNV